MTGNAVLLRGKHVKEETIYVVIRYNSTMFGEAEETLGTFLSMEEANQAVLVSLDDVDDLNDNAWEEPDRQHEYLEDGTMHLWATGTFSRDSETYVTQVVTRKRKLNEPPPIDTVYVVKEEKHQYASRDPDYELESNEVLDVLKDKEAANWFLTRRGDLYEMDITDGFERHLGEEDGLSVVTIDNPMEDEQIIICVAVQRLR